MKSLTNYLIDMDGVLVSGQTLISGAEQFIERLKAKGAKFLVLTNNPLYSPKDLAHSLQRLGLDVPAELIFTSGMATASFLEKQRPNGTAFVIGESGLTSALHSAGYIITEHDPDYVVLGETHACSLESLTKGIRLILNGARFVATNPDPSGPSDELRYFDGGRWPAGADGNGSSLELRDPLADNAAPVLPLLQVSVTRITKAVALQISSVSTNTSNTPYIPCRTGCPCPPHSGPSARCPTRPRSRKAPEQCRIASPS